MSDHLDPPADPRQLLQNRTPRERLGATAPPELTGASGINDATATAVITADRPQGTARHSDTTLKPQPTDEHQQPPDDALPPPQPPVAVP